MYKKHSMKNTSILSAFSKTIRLALLLLTITVFSCKKSENLTTALDSKVKVDSSIIAKIKALGFQTKGITEFQEYYIVEGDIMISKKSLSSTKGPERLMSVGGTISQASTNNLISTINNHNINISVDASIYGDNTWYNALKKAVTVWNSTSNSNVKLNLIYTSLTDYSLDQTNIDITIKGDNNQLDFNTVARAEFPTYNGKPGSLILINLDVKNPFTNNYLNDGQAAWNVIHEIGHCLGLRHTNWETNDPPTSIGENLIAGTPTSDPNSVMNGSTGLSDYSAYTYPLLPSNYDAIAISTLYPVNNSSVVLPYISSNKYFSPGGEDYFKISYLEQGVSYHWRAIGINGTNYDETIGTFTADTTPGIGFPSSGNYQLQCTISGGKYTTPTTVTKNLIVQ